MMEPAVPAKAWTQLTSYMASYSTRLTVARTTNLTVLIAVFNTCTMFQLSSEELTMNMFLCSYMAFIIFIFNG